MSKRHERAGICEGGRKVSGSDGGRKIALYADETKQNAGIVTKENCNERYERCWADAVYGGAVLFVSNKDNQISNLKTQIEKLEAVERSEEPIIIDTDTDESGVSESFSANILTNIKNLEIQPMVLSQ